MRGSLHTIELVLDRAEGALRLLSPEVGTFTRALPRGAVLTPGLPCGTLHRLGVSFELRVPAGATGRIVSRRPERVHQPVDCATVLYELSPLEASVSEAPEEARPERATLVLRAPHSGRFWHRPSPADPPFVEVGTLLEPGTTVGLVEVMKTFTHLAYEPHDALPERARVVRVLVADGAEIDADTPLLELTPN